MNTILLIADDEEPNLSKIKESCQWQGIDYTVLNPGLMAASAMTWSPWDDSFVIRTTSGRTMSSHDWCAIWTRRYSWSAMGIKHPGDRFAAIETAYLWSALTQSLSDRFWMNSTAPIPVWDNRLSQTRLAKSLGWKVPETIITNDPETAKKFLDEHVEIIVKHISSGGQRERADRLLLTRALSLNDREMLDHVVWCPTLLQRRVEKTIELRAIIVDDEVFVGGIQPHEDERSEVDGRLWVVTDLRFSRIDIGAALKKKLVELTHAMGFTYGAIDLLVDGNDEVYFLELNCSGQWGFVETATGYPITETIVARLGEA